MLNTDAFHCGCRKQTPIDAVVKLVEQTAAALCWRRHFHRERKFAKLRGQRVFKRLPHPARLQKRFNDYASSKKCGFLWLHGLCLKSKNRTWTGSVQGAIATWSNQISQADH